MTTKPISAAKNPDLPASYIAMQRTAAGARRVAIETNTGIIVVRDGKSVFIPAADYAKDVSKGIRALTSVQV